MKLFQCKIRKPQFSSEQYALIAVAAEDPRAAVETVKNYYGHHLDIFDMEVRTEDIIFQIGGNVIALPNRLRTHE